MAIEADHFLLVVGIIVVAAFFAALAFHRFRIPDIILLIGLGMALGPVFKFFDVELFESLAPLVGTAALVIILFEGGLKVRVRELMTGVATGSALALLVFLATALLCALVGVVWIGLDAPLALLLGMSLGGAGVVIVIPLIQHLGVSSRAITIVSIEAATSDVLVVLGVVGLSTAIHLKETDPTAFVAHLLQEVIIGVGVGLLAGLAWVRVLKAFEKRSYEYVLTIGTLFLLYAITESDLLGGSGALAVLAFGLVVGNSRKTRRLAEETDVPMRGRPARTWEWTPVFGGELVNLHHEVIFFVRAFFFVTLGAVVNLDVFGDAKFLLGGLLLTICVAAGRYWGVTLLFFRSGLAAWDRMAVTLMFPLGLAAAVVSLIPSRRFGIAGSEEFGAYALVAIVLTNLIASVLVFVTARGHALPQTTPGRRGPAG